MFLTTVGQVGNEFQLVKVGLPYSSYSPSVFHKIAETMSAECSFLEN